MFARTCVCVCVSQRQEQHVSSQTSHHCYPLVLPGFFPLTPSLPFIYDCQDGAIKAISLCWNFILKPFVLLKEK